MSLHVYRAALMAGVLIAVSGCSQSSKLDLQREEISYQVQIGRINSTFIPAPARAKRALALLRDGLRKYSALHPPPPLRKLNARVIAGLRGELRVYAEAASGTLDPAKLRLAEALGARSRELVAVALKRVAATVDACRDNAARC